jgi:cytochrome c
VLRFEVFDDCIEFLAGITGTNRRDRAFNREEALCPAPQEPARKGADTESGQLTFNNACRTCHTTKEGDNRLGPNLHNVIGRKAGSLSNYGYSSAMKGADFVWDKEMLDRFIAKPDEVVPGNNMKPYGGLTSAEDRAKVIVFLESANTN